MDSATFSRVSSGYSLVGRPAIARAFNDQWIAATGVAVTRRRRNHLLVEAQEFVKSQFGIEKTQVASIQAYAQTCASSVSFGKTMLRTGRAAPVTTVNSCDVT
jgi:hypothetical protein